MGLQGANKSAHWDGWENELYYSFCGCTVWFVSYLVATPKTGFLMTMLIFFKLTNPFKKLSLVTKKTVFGVCDQVRFKPACAATEAR